MVGSLMCARYAFMPNRLKYCGPDRNRTLLEYIATGFFDQGLVDILSEFRGAWPYLTFIAHANGISNPLDEQVVEAYWLGNSLLDNIASKQFADFIQERFKGYFPPAAKSEVFKKLGGGGKPHHNFHVYYLFGMASNVTKSVEFSLSTINNCRISWGKVLEVTDGSLRVESDKVAWDDHVGRYCLEPATKVVGYQIEKIFLVQPSPGQYVSIHWGWAGDLLNERQVGCLKRYDNLFLGLP